MGLIKVKFPHLVHVMSLKVAKKVKSLYLHLGRVQRNWCPSWLGGFVCTALLEGYFVVATL